MARYVYKTKPMRHQVKALKKFLRNGCGALFAEMGTGKTKIAIDFACALSVKEGRQLRAVVLCPKSVLTVWPDEIEKHDPFYKMRGVGVKWKLIGVDSAWRPYHYDDVMEWEPDIIIVDESSTIKTPTARRSKGAYLIARRCQYRLIMSGTPIGKNLLDLFAQYKVVDDGIFGTDFGVFKREYAMIRAFKVLKWLHKKRLVRKIKPVTFAIKKDQCLDLPPRRGHIEDPDGPNLVPVTLSPRTRQLYDKLAAEAVVQWENLETMTPIVLTQMLRLSQLAGGWLCGNELIRRNGRLTAKVKAQKRVGQEKKMHLQSMLEDMMEQDRGHVVIFARFLHEVRDCAEAAQAAGYRTLLFHGKVSTKRRRAKIKMFHRVEQPTVFISQISTGSMGIDLTPAAECIFYSTGYSLIQYLQACDRLHRMGQTRHVTYYHLVAVGTIDYAVITSLMEKHSLAKAVLQNPQLAYGRGKNVRDIIRSTASSRRSNGKAKATREKHRRVRRRSHRQEARSTKQAASSRTGSRRRRAPV